MPTITSFIIVFSKNTYSYIFYWGVYWRKFIDDLDRPTFTSITCRPTFKDTKHSDRKTGLGIVVVGENVQIFDFDSR